MKFTSNQKIIPIIDNRLLPALFTYLSLFEKDTYQSSLDHK